MFQRLPPITVLDTTVYQVNNSQILLTSTDTAIRVPSTINLEVANGAHPKTDASKTMKRSLFVEINAVQTPIAKGLEFAAPMVAVRLILP